MVVETTSFRPLVVCKLPAWRHIRSLFFSLILAMTAHGALYAQGSPGDPVEYFENLLAQGSSLDQARQSTTYYFGSAVGTELAVYVCSPDAERVCMGSEVYAAWDYFLELIEDYEYSVDVAVKYMHEHYDQYLVNSIAVNWCSPDPQYGCQGSRYNNAWGRYLKQVNINGNQAAAVATVRQVDPGLAEFIGAFECAEPTCFAAEIASLTGVQLAELRSVTSQSNTSQSSRQASSKLKFLREPKSSKSATRAFLDKLKEKSKPSG